MQVLGSNEFGETNCKSVFAKPEDGYESQLEDQSSGFGGGGVAALAL